MVGVPIDGKEPAEDIEAYVRDQAPPYHVLAGFTPEDRERVRNVLLRTLQGRTALPSTIITDGKSGRVLRAFKGVPTVSDVARLLDDGQRR